jgi:hypothetical protein
MKHDLFCWFRRYGFGSLCRSAFCSLAGRSSRRWRRFDRLTVRLASLDHLQWRCACHRLAWSRSLSFFWRRHFGRGLSCR